MKGHQDSGQTSNANMTTNTRIHQQHSDICHFVFRAEISEYLSQS